MGVTLVAKRKAAITLVIDATSLGKKYDLVNADSLRGVGIWNLNYGGGAPELWAALASHFSQCTSATIAAAPAAPGGTGVVVTVTAGSDGCSSPSYRFWLQAPGGAWTIVQDYSPRSPFAWTATGAPGTYHLEADARSGTTEPYDAVANLTYVLQPCSAASLASALASPQKPGASIVLTASATCLGVPEYRFWIRRPGASWTVVRDYSPSASYTWITTGLVSGSYALEVDVRNQGAAAPYEATFNMPFVLDPPCTTTALTASPASPQPAGTAVTLTASATGCSTPEYQFWVQPPGGAWTVLQSYGGNTAPWSTTGLADGTYNLDVWARQQSAGVSVRLSSTHPPLLQHYHPS